MESQLILSKAGTRSQIERSFRPRNTKKYKKKSTAWVHPASLYRNSRLDNDDDLTTDEDDNNNNSDVASQSSLDGADIHSLTDSAASAVNSMMYSEDDASAKSWASWRLPHDSCSRDCGTLPNAPHPLFMNVDLLQVHENNKRTIDNHSEKEDLNSITSSSCGTKESSLISSTPDHYFEPSANERGPSYLLRNIVSDDSSDSDSEHYIFTDDDDVVNNFKTTNHPSDDDASSISEGVEIPSTWREREWSSFHQRRGRLLAQLLLEKASRTTVSSSSNSSLNSSVTDLNDDDGSYQSLLMIGHNNTRRRSFLARAVRSLRNRVACKKQLMKKSSSSLDKNLHSKENSPWDTRSQGCKEDYRSAVSARNKFAEFESWEAATSKALFTVDEDDFEDHCAELEETTVTSESQDDPLVIKMFSSQVRPTARSSSLLSSSYSKEVQPIVPPVSLFASTFDYCVDDDSNGAEWVEFGDEIEEPRTSSEAVAASLGIEAEGVDLLLEIRDISGTLHVEEEDIPQSDKAGQLQMPVIQLSSGLWMSQYEEYVFRAINTFSRRLLLTIGQQLAMLMEE